MGYCTRMLCSVTGAEYVAPDEQQPGTSLFELDLHADYALIEQSLLQVEDLPIVGTKETMLKVLDSLGEMHELPPLYRCYVSRNAPQPKLNQDLELDTRLASRHVGQMTGEFPLSAKQRHALHHFLRQEDGEMLAVNGPRGPARPPCCVRSSPTCGRKPRWTRRPPLIGGVQQQSRPSPISWRASPRWTRPALTNVSRGAGAEVDSYGLYCCASHRANDQNPYLYHGPRGEGCMQAWQTREYFERARHHFLLQAGHWQGGSATDFKRSKRPCTRP